MQFKIILFIAFSGCFFNTVIFTLDSGIDVGQGIIVEFGTFAKKNKCRARQISPKNNKFMNLILGCKFENICRAWKKFQNLINVKP